jgi:Cu/Ag efflux protein CusF
VSWRRLLLAGAAVAVLAAGAAAWFLLLPQEDFTVPGVYHGTGMVLAVLPAPSPLDAKRPVIILRHEPIPELMDKGMTHPFIVGSEKLLRDIGPGMQVRFTLKDTPGALLVVRLEAVP